MFVYLRPSSVPEDIIKLPHSELLRLFKDYPKNFFQGLMKIRRRIKNREYGRRHRLNNLKMYEKIFKENEELIKKNKELLEKVEKLEILLDIKKTLNN